MSSAYRRCRALLVRFVLPLGFAVLALSACSSAATSADAAMRADGGADRKASTDVAVSDDGGSDPPPMDTSVDASVTEAKGDGLSACAAAYAKCVRFVDRSAPSASRVITFKDYDYTPKCIRIKAGQKVVFRGDFVRHPLQQACGPADVIPFINVGTKKEYSFVGRPGIYGYYCVDHGSSTGVAMAGAIEVRGAGGSRRRWK